MLLLASHNIIQHFINYFILLVRCFQTNNRPLFYGVGAFIIFKKQMIWYNAKQVYESQKATAILRKTEEMIYATSAIPGFGKNFIEKGGKNRKLTL